jgi:CheY-like chemotaxis protein
VVSSGPEAQQLASDQSYDLVILDLHLPGGGGLDILSEIRAKRPDLPVVIVAGASMMEERVRGLDAGRTTTSQNRLRLPNLPRAFALFCAEERGPRGPARFPHFHCRAGVET